MARRRVFQDRKRPGDGMIKWQPWCRKKSAYLYCGRVRESVSARKDAGARNGVGVIISLDTAASATNQN